MKIKLFITLMLISLSIAVTGAVSADELYTFTVTEADHVEEHDNTWYIDLSIPQISGLADKDAEDQLNANFLEWRDSLLEEYNHDKQEMQESYEGDELPHFGYEYNWEVLFDTPDHFVVRTYSYYAAGSSMTVNEFWTLNKHDGSLMEITDVADRTRLEEIRSMIFDAMNRENETEGVFWADEEGFKNAFSFVEEYHHWYVNDSNNPVFTFDKYEIAPGAIGESRFEILDDKAILIKESSYSFDLYTGETVNVDEDNWYLHISLPVIGGMADQTEEDELNQHFADMADRIKQEFETSAATLEESVKDGDGPHFGYEYSYEILADTNDYFSFRTISFFAAGSSMTSCEFWTLDKNTGKQVRWEDVVPADGMEKIHDRIFAEMTAANESGNGLYYTDDEALNFALSNIDNYHHWYLNSDGDLVIAFDKYEIAVGAQGTPEFVIQRQ